MDYLEKFSIQIKKETVPVLDNARIHRSKLFQQARQDWEKRGLFVFFLPSYSPELNRAEIVWRRLKHNGLYGLLDFGELEICYQSSYERH